MNTINDQLMFGFIGNLESYLFRTLSSVTTVMVFVVHCLNDGENACRARSKKSGRVRGYSFLSWQGWGAGEAYRLVGY
jgi:hypothetical protein